MKELPGQTRLSEILDIPTGLEIGSIGLPPVADLFRALLESLHDVETRVTDEETGGQKGAKLTQVGALDPVALIELARVAGMGANKYAAHNYLKGYDWSLSFNAMMRHALLFWAGEDRDTESGRIHMAHAAWMALSLVSFSMRQLGNDDRPPR